jgi:hypothetical protein
MVRHDDEVMELVLPFSTIVLESFKEELCVRSDLEEATRIVGSARDEERPVACCSGRDSHCGESLSQMLAKEKLNATVFFK